MSTHTRSRMQSRAVSELRRLPGSLALAIGISVLVVPFLIAVSIAIRPAADVSRDPLGFPTSITFDNVIAAYGQLDYGISLINTVIFVAASSVAVVLFGAMASYPLARISRRWTELTYRFFLLGTTIPIFVLIGPLYLFMRDIHLLNTHVGVVIIYTAMNLPTAIFFFTSFIRGVPVELEEAAAIDGSGPFRIFFSIVLPLVRPVSATLLTFLTLVIWNDLVIPLVFVQGQGNRTIMANAFALIDPRKVEPTTLFPAALLGVLPLIVVFAFLQRQVIDGISAGAVK